MGPNPGCREGAEQFDVLCPLRSGSTSVGSGATMLKKYRLCFPDEQDLFLRSALFWNITQHIVTIPHRRFRYVCKEYPRSAQMSSISRRKLKSRKTDSFFQPSKCLYYILVDFRTFDLVLVANGASIARKP